MAEQPTSHNYFCFSYVLTLLLYKICSISINLGILSYIGDPPKDGQFAYYPETDGFKLRVRCNGKVDIYSLFLNYYVFYFN